MVEVAGDNLNEKDDERRTPLFEANSTDVITYLIDYGVSFEEEDLTRFTVLEHAIFDTYPGQWRMGKRVEYLRTYVKK